LSIGPSVTNLFSFPFVGRCGGGWVDFSPYSCRRFGSPKTEEPAPHNATAITRAARTKRLEAFVETDSVNERKEQKKKKKKKKNSR